MKIEEINIDEIKPYKTNPREISKESIDKVKKSIKEFGNNQPIVIDQDNIIVVGHTRWKALKELHKKKAYVVKKEFDKNKAIAYRIMDNRSGEESKWETKLLKAELEALKTADFDLDLTGFNAEELDNYFFKNDELMEQVLNPSDFDGKINDVQMIQIFYDPENEKKFREAIEKVKTKHKVDNISDAVLKAVLNEADSS